MRTRAIENTIAALVSHGAQFDAAFFAAGRCRNDALHVERYDASKPKRARQENVSNVPAFYAIRAKTISIMCAIIPDACAGADTK